MAKFAREGRWHFIPVYWVLRLSDFAREGMERSGSYRFADHMYRGVPSGRGWIGRLLDAALLRMPAVRSMRQRCFESRDAMRRAFDERGRSGVSGPFRILTVPCGLPRDVRDFTAILAADDPAAAASVEYTGIDLDPKVVEEAGAFLAGSALRNPVLRRGNALNRDAYPVDPPHLIASTGLGEFLDDDALAVFYRNVFDALAPGGVFFTSAAAEGQASEVLLRAFELDVHYRTSADVQRLLARHPWKSLEITRDAVGLQTFVFARKGE